jgi:DNA polymerase III epsilon subunit-like protein
MNETIDFVDIKRQNNRGKTYLKYPKLIELYNKLFHDTTFNQHDAMEDVRACVRCYFKFEHDIDVNDINTKL